MGTTKNEETKVERALPLRPLAPEGAADDSERFERWLSAASKDESNLSAMVGRSALRDPNF